MARTFTPTEAVERYLKERKAEVSDATYRNHSYTLKRFARFCDEQGIENISNLDGWDIGDFKLARREDGISEVTLYNNMCVIRVFAKWLAARGLIDAAIHENMQLPEAKGVRHDKISDEVAEDILDYLTKFEYATLRHALFALLWDTGMRLGAVRAIDLDDYHPGEQYIELHHRPETDTTLKNKEEGEREVNLHEWVCDVLDDFIAMNRPDTTDEHDREPLFTSKYGRCVRSNLRAHINAVTRPCHYSGECPHDRNPEECEAKQQYKYAQRCPSSVTPHDIRRSAITSWLNRGHSSELLTDRMNVSQKILDKHYDKRTEEEKRELRREMFGMD